MITLSIKNAIKRYPNGALAVKGVSVEVQDGELVVFVGPSGCGKSTLLRMVAGLEDVTEGDIELGGKIVNDMEPADRNIAMVFQNYALYPHMSVRKNLAYGLKNRGTAQDVIDAKVKEAAEMLQIVDFLDRKPSQLSGGQRQRVAMGRAIVRDPAIFLFDEPLSNLDAKLRNQMRLEIKRLQRRLKVAAIYVTHDQVEAMTLADRIVVINQGLVEQIGTPNEVYTNPASTFVANFIGSPPMNLFAGEVTNGTLRLGEHEIATNSQADGRHIVGIRPEHIEVTTDTGLTIKADTIEDLGATRLVHAQIGGTMFTLSTTLLLDQLHDDMYVNFPPAHLHWFDPENGKAR